MSKQCTKCKEIKELSEFGKDSVAKDGLKHVCKSCRSNLAKQDRLIRHDQFLIKESLYRETNRERINKQHKEHYYRNQEEVIALVTKYHKDRPEICRRASLKSSKKFPEKKRARNQLNTSIKNGTLIKPPSCSECGKTDCRIEGHHHDYTKPLDVTWYCTQCHNNEHQRLKMLEN